MPTLHLAKSHFVPGQAAETTSGASEGPTRGGAQGTNPGNAPFNSKISDHPNNLDLPGHLPFTIGPAVSGEGGGDPEGHVDDQRDGH
eukprot:8344557-Pyramimonas_sp.AAC.1